VDRTVAAGSATGPRASDAAQKQHAASAEESQDAGLLAQAGPNDQLVVGAVPRQPPGFQPRPHLTNQLNRSSRGVSVLTGAQGMGKTELAAAYARAMLAEGWRLVAWVKAEEPASLRGGLAELADAVGLADGSERHAVDAGRAVREWLEADGEHRLLVFDDADDPDALRPFVPADGAARVLITTTRQSVADLGSSVPVEAFSADEALAALGARTGLADSAGAAEVAAELGHLPLAIAQAAAVITGQDLGYLAYLARLRTVRIEDRLAREQGQPYPPGVAEAICLSLDEVRALDATDVSTGVLELMAVLSPAGVRRELLHAAARAGVLADGVQQMGTNLADPAVEWLSDLSLLTVSMDGQVVTMHSLVRQVVREGLARREQLATECRAAVRALEAHAEALAGSHDRPSLRDIPQQVMALLDNTPPSVAEADGELASGLLRLRFLALYHLIELGDSAPQAVTVGESLTADLEWVRGPDHPDTLNCRNSLATAYLAAGRTAESLPMFEQTLSVRERRLGPDHPDTLNSQNNLATAYQDTGRVADAIPLFERTLAARERVLGANHRSTVNSRGNLAAAYRDAGRTDEAILLFEQTLAVRERMLGPDHPDTLRSRNNLVNAYREKGRIAEAIPLAEQILAAQERLLRADHPRILSSRNNLAVAYRDVGRVAEAIPLFERNLAACERLFGADHPRTLSTRNNLAACQEAPQPEEG
jgi:tetratricopeptide (TPR) repeat protein